MKIKTLFLTTLGSLLLALSLNAQLSFAVNVTGTPSENDILAATKIVEEENAKRAAEEPPGTPLPYSNLSELASSYETVLASIVEKAHTGWAKAAKQEALETQVKDLWLNATDAQRAAAVAALQE